MPNDELQHERVQWLQERQPTVAMHLPLSANYSGEIAAKLVSIDDAEAIVVCGAVQIHAPVIEWLENGGKLLMVFAKQEHLLSYLATHFFLPHENIFFSLGMPYEYQLFFQQTLFSKVRFEGDLPEARYYHDTMHLAASEYRDFAKDVLSNIQRNLMHTKAYIDGRSLEGAHAGQSVILTGSGPSLETHMALVKERQKTHIIIAAGSSLPKLLKAGIVPDYFLFIDPNPPLEIYEGIQAYDFPLIYQNRMSADLFCQHKGPKIWMGHSGAHPIEKTLLKKAGIAEFTLDVGWHAGNFAHVVAKHFGFERIATVGMEGSQTKKDLKRGLDWNQDFAKKYGIEVALLEEIAPCLTKEKCMPMFSLQRANHESTLSFVKSLWSEDVLGIVTAFLQCIEKGVNSHTFQIETALFESDFHHTALYRNILEPLWGAMQSIYLQEGSEVERKIQEVCFMKKAIEVLKEGTKSFSGLQEGFCFGHKCEGMIERKSKSGNVLSKGTFILGLKDGVHQTFDKDGSLQSSVTYKRGKKHGLYQLLYPNGQVKKEGLFVEGQPHKKHTCYDEHGGVLDIAEYTHGEKCGLHRIFSRRGILKEEVFFHTKDRFDKKLYDERGELYYEGEWKGETFYEYLHGKGQRHELRKGRWVNGGIAWAS